MQKTVQGGQGRNDEVTIGHAVVVCVSLVLALIGWALGVWG